MIKMSNQIKRLKLDLIDGVVMKFPVSAISNDDFNHIIFVDNTKTTY